MPKKNDNYLYVRTGSLEPILIKDILTKNWFLQYTSVFEYEQYSQYIEFEKDIKTIISSCLNDEAKEIFL